MSDPKKNPKELKLRFGVYRARGDVDKNSPLAELWKQDESIHSLQFRKEKYEIPHLKEAPRLKDYLPSDNRGALDKLLGKNKREYADLKEAAILSYEEDLQKFNENIESLSKKNAVIDTYRSVKRENNYICQFCTFVDRRYIEIHHIDGNHENNEKNNLTTACTLCHLQHHLFWVSLKDKAQLGVQSNSAITQAELNTIQRVAIVMSHHSNSEYRSLYGLDGKLGTLMQSMKNKFNRPLHSSLMPRQKKEEIRSGFIQSEQLRSSITNVEADYHKIKAALLVLESKKPTEADKINIAEYDKYINISTKKDGVEDGEFREDQRSTVVTDVNNYELEIEKHINEVFQQDETFSVFELAIALKEVSYDAYLSFNQECLFLLFNNNVFSSEQIEYYLSLDEFNPETWGDLN